MITKKKYFYNFEAVIYKLSMSKYKKLQLYKYLFIDSYKKKGKEVNAVKKLSLVFLTFAIIGIGAGMLVWSMNHIMANARKSFSSSETVVETKAEAEELTELLHKGSLDKKIEKLQEDIEGREGQYEVLWKSFTEKEEYSIATAEFVYYGQSVSIKDDMVEKESAIKIGEKIMDFIFDDIDKTFLIPEGIDKTEYIYKIQRRDEGGSIPYYDVFLEKAESIGGDNVSCHIIVYIDNGIKKDLCMVTRTRLFSNRTSVYVTGMDNGLSFEE